MLGLLQDEIKENAAEFDDIGKSISKIKKALLCTVFIAKLHVYSLKNRRTDSFFLKQHDIEIAMFSETWLRDSIPDAPIEIKDYCLFRRDRKIRAHGEVCIY